MADRIVKPDTGNDLVLQNDDASAKIEINEAGTIVATPSIQTDNIKIDGNAITSENTNGNIDLTPNGTGEVNISKVDIDAGTIDGTDVTVGASKTLDVSAGTLTSSTAQKQAIVQAGPGSGTLDVSSGTFTSSTAQKDAIVDGSTAISRSGNNLTFAGTIATGAGITIPDGSTIGSASDTDAISISSGGLVVDSARPAFSVYGDQGGSGTDVTNNSRIPFNQETYDRGSNWDTSNYYFDVPITGVYLFRLQLYHYDGATLINFEIVSEDSSDSDTFIIGRERQNASGNDMMFNYDALSYLVAGRRVSVKNTVGSTRKIYLGSAGSHTVFQGALIG